MTDREIDDCWREEREGREGGREREGGGGRKRGSEGGNIMHDCLLIY